MAIYKGFLASSEDPTQLSLTVQSLSKVLIGAIGWYAASKNFNAATATTTAQGIIDIVVQLIPISFTVWHSIIALWGLVRKLINTFGTKTVVVQPVTPVEPVVQQ